MDIFGLGLVAIIASVAINTYSMYVYNEKSLDLERLSRSVPSLTLNIAYGINNSAHTVYVLAMFLAEISMSLNSGISELLKYTLYHELAITTLNLSSLSLFGILVYLCIVVSPGVAECYICWKQTKNLVLVRCSHVTSIAWYLVWNADTWSGIVSALCTCASLYLYYLQVTMKDFPAKGASIQSHRDAHKRVHLLATYMCVASCAMRLV